MSPAEFKAMTARLAALGEDQDELEYWELIYDTLSVEAKVQLDENLRKELAMLESLARREVVAAA